jgi:hypothetical protein
MSNNDNDPKNDEGEDIDPNQNDSGFIPVGPFKQESFDQLDAEYQEYKEAEAQQDSNIITSHDIMKIIFFIMEPCKEFDPSSKESARRTKHALDTILLLMLTLRLPF